jgi:hypothetical protein
MAISVCDKSHGGMPAFKRAQDDKNKKWNRQARNAAEVRNKRGGTV